MSYHQIIINKEIYQLIPLGFCACGCGGKTTIPKGTCRKLNRIKNRPMKYISGHHSKNPFTNPNWKGGQFTDSRGYKFVYAPDHPEAHRNHVFEHRILAEKALGKPLPKKAHVHHHTPNQLVICQNCAYHKLIHQRTRAYKACGHASWRKCKFCKNYDAPQKLNISSKPRGSAYHKSCCKIYDHQRNKQNKKEKLLCPS